MKRFTSKLIAVALLGFVGCAGSPPGKSHATVDIISDSFPEAQAAIRAEIDALNDIGGRHDWDALRSAHLEGPKFSEIGSGFERNGFEEMIAAEIAGVSAAQDLSIEFRDLKIDVFGDVAVATSFPVYSWAEGDGERGEAQVRATMVYVRTSDGWKIAHEHVSSPETE